MYPIFSSLAFFKSIPESLPSNPGYLSFQSPPKLRFHEIEPLADRRKLLTQNKKTELPVIERPVPVSPQEEVFPLVSFEDDNSTEPSVYELPPQSETFLQSEPDISLAPSDPFVPQSIPEPNLNNTDELIDILESNLGTSIRSIDSNLNFVPPYTVDGGNLIIQSKSKYTRKIR